jgi:isopentenyl phosphate kinase
MTTVLKLGGSVVTDKETPETVDTEVLAAVTDAIAQATEFDGGPADLVLVHGGGSFGHHRAARWDLSETAGTHDAAAVTDVHDGMSTLSDAVVGALQDRGVPAVPVRPLSAARKTEDGDLALATEPLAALRAEGFVPVLHGDVVAHRGVGATVVSGDDLVVSLATALDVSAVGLCSAVPGVLDAEGEVIERIDALAEVEDALGGSADTDVTGGMAAKVRKLLALEVPAAIFGRSALPAFLDGERPGTEIRGTPP